MRDQGDIQFSFHNNHLFISFKDVSVGIDPPVPEEGPAATDIFRPVQIEINHPDPFFVRAELSDPADPF